MQRKPVLAFSSRALLLGVLPITVLSAGLAGCNKAPDAQPVATAAPISYLDTVYVPGKDDKLHPHPVPRNAVDSQIKSGGNPTPALDEVVRAAPAYFPPDTRVKGFKTEDKHLVVDMNKAFANPKHWSKGELTTELAVYALVNSAAQVDKSGKTPVQITVEGEPVTSLGEFDAGGTIDPEPKFLAKK